MPSPHLAGLCHFCVLVVSSKISELKGGTRFGEVQGPRVPTLCLVLTEKQTALTSLTWPTRFPLGSNPSQGLNIPTLVRCLGC